MLVCVSGGGSQVLRVTRDKGLAHTVGGVPAPHPHPYVESSSPSQLIYLEKMPRAGRGCESQDSIFCTVIKDCGTQPTPAE